jgi:hypothetical protein
MGYNLLCLSRRQQAGRGNLYLLPGIQVLKMAARADFAGSMQGILWDLFN